MGKRRIGKRMKIIPVCYLCGQATGQVLTEIEDKAVRDVLPADARAREVPVATSTRPCAVCQAMIDDGGVFFLRIQDGAVQHTGHTCIRGSAARKLFADNQIPWKEGTHVIAFPPAVYDQVFSPQGTGQ